jgi:uncharacterized protein
MKYEWDDNKNNLNFKKHGIKFEEAIEIFKGIVFTALSDNKQINEIRKISIGKIQDIIIIVVIHTDRNGRMRIISARRAGRKERSKFYEYSKDFEKKIK